MPITVSGIIPVNLSDLHDVSIVNPQASQYLRYSGTSWQNSYLNSDVFNYLQTSLISTDGVTLDFSNPTNISIGLATVNTTAGTFGSSTSTPVITTDAQGRITAITTVTTVPESANSLTTARTISATGDATWSVSFNGSTNVNSALTLATVNSAPVTNSFQKITTNSKGLVTTTSAVSSTDITSSLGYTPLNVAGDTMTGALILNADPVSPLGAVTKQYADAIASGVNVHPACETATIAALPSCTYNNGASGVGATLTATSNGAIGTIGGYSSLSIGSRILVKNQVTQLQNGIYGVSDLGSVSTPWILTRTADYDGSPTTEVVAGDLSYVQEGSLSGTQWVQVNVGTGHNVSPGYDYIIVGTDAIAFVQFSGPGLYTAGTGIGIASNVISNTGVTSLVAGTNISVSSSTGAVTVSLSGTVPTATSSTNSTNAAITNNATTSTAVYPTWVSANTGNLPLQTTSTKLSFVPSTGVLSATSFTGAGTGLTGTAASLSIGGNAATVTNGVYTTDVGVVTNTMLAGSIANAKLANSSLTIGTTAISLGTSSLTLAGLTSVAATTFTGSGSGLTGIPNSALVGSGSITLGSTNVPLGTTIANIAGLTSVTATTFTGALTGNASTATKATNIAGGIAGSLPYQTAANTTGMLAAGADGNVLTLSGGIPIWSTPTAGITSFNTRTGAITLISSDVTTALGFTPYDSANPAGYTNNTGTVTSVSGTGTVSGLTLAGSVTTSGSLTLGGSLTLTSSEITTALGFTPYSSTNPAGYITSSGTAANISGTYTGSISSAQITTGLGFTPYSSTNPAGYITSSGSISGNAATATTSTKATNIAGGSAGSLPYQSAANTTAMLAAGTNGYVLTLAGGVPTWAPTGGGSGSVSSFNTRTGAITLTSSDVITALGYTPGSGSGSGSVTSVSGTGTVSGLTLTGTVTTSGSLTLGGALSLASSDITTALGFTPYDSANPDGYITSSGTAANISGTYSGSLTSGQITSGLGYTPYDSANPVGYITSAGTAANISGTYTGPISSSQVTIGLGFTPYDSWCFSLMRNFRFNIFLMFFFNICNCKTV